MNLIKKKCLHNYQIQTIDKIKQLKKCALFFEMSLGKTITTLSAISELLMRDEIKTVLIIAPLRVANTVWKQESEKWEHTYWLSKHIGICTGSIKEKKAILSKNYKIIITNKDNLAWFNSNNSRVFDCVIIDESSAFKNASTLRFKSVRKLCIDSQYTILLTGTPSPNSLIELWPQIFLLDQGERLGKTISSFKGRFFYRTGYNGYELKLFDGADTKIKELIEDICITLKASDYIQLPEKIINTVYAELDDDNKKIYKTMNNEFIIQLNSGEITAINAAAKAGKLLQFANGFMYDDEKQAHYFHNHKIDVLKEIIENNPNENILIAYNFQHDLVMLKKAFINSVLIGKQGKEIAEWNKGNIKLLLAHPASAGHGLNLQAGGSIVVWYSMTWSLENYLQFNARIHRQGQTKPVKIIHLLTKNTLDEKVLTTINNKDTTQENFINKLKLVLLEEELNA